MYIYTLSYFSAHSLCGLVLEARDKVIAKCPYTSIFLNATYFLSLLFPSQIFKKKS